MTTSWKQALAEGAVSGTLAALLSGAFLVAAGRRHGTPAAPLNAVSHWFFGDQAFQQDRPSLRYTLTGFLTHHGASIFWGVLHAKWWAARPQARQALPAAVGAIATSGIANVVDYQLTPDRFKPGYEQRLSRGELAGVYALFALGLALGSVLLKRR